MAQEKSYTENYISNLLKDLNTELMSISSDLDNWNINKEKIADITKSFINLLEDKDFVHISSELKYELRDIVQHIANENKLDKLIVNKNKLISMVDDMNCEWSSARENIIKSLNEKYERSSSLGDQESKIFIQKTYDRIEEIFCKKEDILEETYKRLLECYKNQSDWSLPKENFQKARQQFDAFKKAFNDFTNDWKQSLDYGIEIRKNPASVPDEIRKRIMQLAKAQVNRATEVYEQVLTCYEQENDPSSDHKKDLDDAYYWLRMLNHVSCKRKDIHNYQATFEKAKADGINIDGLRINKLVKKAETACAKILDCCENNNREDQLSENRHQLDEAVKELEKLMDTNTN